MMSGKECDSFKVLLVEDDEGFRRNLAALLTSWFPSLAIGEARDSAEAIGRVESFLPHLIFMDIKLPGQNGLELTKRIKRLHPEIEVVILTSYDYPEYRDAAIASGACSFLSKGTATGREIQDLVEALRAKCVAYAA